MIFTYFFEAKSIQRYLFRGDKLKDIIAASERLDTLIDDSKNSVLSYVLETGEIASDLHDPAQQSNSHLIRFIRVKGGAFYAYCHSEAPLLKLRASWTLLVQQLFPSLPFTDALTSAPTLQQAISTCHKKLAENKNIPLIEFPLASAITERCARTGGARVPALALVNSANKDESFDVDTELHRQAYQVWDMQNKAALQDKFTPPSLLGKIKYPVNLDKDFQFASKHTPLHKEAIKDLAIIHIDGNGLGIMLRELQQALGNATDDEYRQTFRGFSNALSTATQEAAQQATLWLYNTALSDAEKQSNTFLPMRPIVMGGDDITLLCRADLALEYSKRFCIAFKQSSQKALTAIFSQLKSQKSPVNPKIFLTASGGILYHKSGHPFTHSHHLVEGLCKTAKALSKKVDAKIGPAALSFYRLSNAVAANIEELIEQSQCFLQGDSLAKAGPNKKMRLGFNTYLVERDASGEACFNDLEDCIALSTHKHAAIGMAKWRNMASHLALGNKTEAERLYSRAIAISDNRQAANARLQGEVLQRFKPNNANASGWYWQNNIGELQTIINDLLVVEHFSGKQVGSVEHIPEAKI
jgi:hypothetical protein